MFAFLSYFSVSAMIYVCGNYKGGKECHVFKGKCDDASNLTALGAHFPGGWTCINFGLATGGDVRVVQENTGRAFVIINGEKQALGPMPRHQELGVKIEYQSKPIPKSKN
ncbi:MAG: hypothetical protein IPL27_13955 [Lewinellaceae bacterium]|nr:hypothetical protein [Lewinellaceae bacterium]